MRRTRLKVGFIIAYLEWVSKHARFMTKSEENLKKSVDSGFEICYNDLRQRHKFIGELCNGSTYDSDSYCLGSNPSSPAICLHGQAVKTLPSQGKIMGSIPIGGATKQNVFVLFFLFRFFQAFLPFCFYRIVIQNITSLSGFYSRAFFCLFDGMCRLNPLFCLFFHYEAHIIRRV